MRWPRRKLDRAQRAAIRAVRDGRAVVYGLDMAFNGYVRFRHRDYDGPENPVLASCHIRAVLASDDFAPFLRDGDGVFQPDDLPDLRPRHAAPATPGAFIRCGEIRDVQIGPDDDGTPL